MPDFLWTPRSILNPDRTIRKKRLELTKNNVRDAINVSTKLTNILINFIQNKNDLKPISNKSLSPYILINGSNSKF